MKTIKNILVPIVLLLWPFLLCICVYFWQQPKIKEKEERDIKEILSDTAKVNAAHRTYERVHHELLMEDPDYSELYEENLRLKDSLEYYKRLVR